MSESLQAVLSAAEITPVLADVGCSGARHVVWDPIASSSVLIAFDPDSRDVPRDVADRYRDVIMINRAVVERDDVDSVAFVLTRYPSCSSTLEPNLEALGAYAFKNLFIPESRVCVQATSLNHVISECELPGIDWLKLDSQGTDLRIIRSLHPDAFSRLLAVDVEPGLIDAYIGEDLFTETHNYLTKAGFWISDLRLQRYPRIRAEMVNEFDQMCQAVGVKRELQARIGSPTAAEARYLRGLNQMMGSRSLVLLFVFAILDGRLGFAFEALRDYANGDGDKQVLNTMQQSLTDALRDLKIQASIRHASAYGLANRAKALLKRLLSDSVQ